MTMALLPRAPTYNVFVGVLKGTKSTFEVDILTNPITKKLARIVLRSRNSTTRTLTETVSNEFFMSNQETFLEFGRQLQLGRLLDDDVFDTLIHQMCENAPITYDIGLQTALWNDHILHQTELAKHILPIESKEAKLKKELVSLAYRNPKKMKDFFEEYDSTSVPYGLNGETFTPWEGGSSDMERFRVWECGFEYVNPPEKLVVIGYIEDDAVVMVGSQSGKVYMDEDEIVYNVANNLSDFANHGCPYNPTFFDYYLARPNDVRSLPCAAGTFEECDKTADVPEDSKWTFIGHDPDQLEADRERASQMYAEMAEYFKPPSEVFLDFTDQQEDPFHSQSFFAQFGDGQEDLWSSPCKGFPSTDPFPSQFSSMCIEIKS
ncbi:PREDICTED: uncharacterized protein LOC109469378 [Branchiostoma belcheri]|uniref:Uncharacterized protein LOC109469378 n=1 Tax=Branchiostoma belcheri TaxID=7741 RepID=A0A6P4YG69_BRABE|nr:PREDICTED: uncharacterized protein LOC109469378 [Branchiostoma belcheri]